MALLQNLLPFLDNVNISLIVRPWKDHDGKLFVLMSLKPHKALKTPPFDKAVTLKAWGTAEEIEQQLTSDRVQTQISAYSQQVLQMSELEKANVAGKSAIAKKADTKAPAKADEKTPVVKPAAKAAAKTGTKEEKSGQPALMAFMLVMTEIEDLKKGGEEDWKDKARELRAEFSTKAKEAMAEAPLSEAIKARAKKVQDILNEAKQIDIT